MPGKCNLPSNILFQFSPSHRGHPWAGICLQGRHSFNSRPRTEGIAEVHYFADNIAPFQFSPSHRGHHSLYTKAGQAIDVSILALAQRASKAIGKNGIEWTVSILALAQRASGSIPRLNVTAEVSILALAQRASDYKG